MAQQKIPQDFLKGYILTLCLIIMNMDNLVYDSSPCSVPYRDSRVLEIRAFEELIGNRLSLMARKVVNSTGIAQYETLKNS